MIIVTAEILVCNSVMYKLDVFTINNLLYLTAIIVPVDFGEHKGMYLSKVNITFRILFYTVYMQLGVAVNEIYGRKLKT
jgi:hypothetical protein